jgi:lipooligosaccharide transport system permease protein
MTAPVLRLVEREARVMRHLWHGLVFTAFVQPLLYLVAMGVGLGGYVDDSSPASLGDVDYLVFVAPGLLAASVFQLVVGESLWPVMGGVKWDKRYRAMVSSPLRPSDVLAGHLTWQSLRTIVTAVGFLLVAAPLGALASWWAVMAIPSAVLLVVAVSAPVAAWSTFTDEDASFPLVMRFGVLPLFLFSGTFFPTSGLPDWLQRIVPLSPLYHGVELCRAATTGQSPGLAALAGHVAFLVGLAAVSIAIGRRTFTNRLTP